MAGLFRYNTASSTPIRRHTLSPFCTSPGQLQDVTMDSSYALGYRSPCHGIQHGGSSSPGQGRSVREFEEQMAALRKENFNLKLRIYFLEEKIPGYSSSNNNQDGHDSLLKQNVDLKVDIEVLRRELQEKQTLLCEAAKAMDLMEKQQKTTEEQSQAIIDELNEKIRYLESENKEFENKHHTLDDLMGRTELGNDIDTVQKIRELEGFVKQYELKTGELNEKINDLETTINQNNEIINNLETKIKEIEYQNSELQEQLDFKTQEATTVENDLKKLNKKLNIQKEEFENEKQKIIVNFENMKENYEKEKINLIEQNKKNESQQKIIEDMQHQKLKDELLENKRKLADTLCTLDEVETQLQQKTKEHEKACSVIQKLLKNTKDLQTEIERLQKPDLSCQSGIQQLKEDAQANDASYLKKTISFATEAATEWTTLKNKLENLVAEKDAEIKKLKLEVKKKTANLQNLVNKELWEKNREIERLTKLLNKTQSQAASMPNSPTKDIDQLQQSFTDSDYSAALERNKILQKKVDTLIQKLYTNAEDNNCEPTILQHLKIELKEARDDAEKAHRWRKECADVCEILKDRLEELAGFLDTLLEDNVLSVLAADKRRAMRKAVNRSLEMSRSLTNMSLSRSCLSIGGPDENSLMRLSNISGLLNLTTENKENHTFNLQHEDNKNDLVIIENLKAEIKALKKELDRKKIMESVRKERRSLPMNFNENQSESEAWSEPDRKVSLARIGLEEPMLIKSNISNLKEENINESTTTESEGDLIRKSKWCKAQKKISLLEQMITERDNRILEVQCELVEADNRLKKENLRLIEVERELIEYRKVNEMLEIEIAKFKTQDLNELKYENETLKRQINEKDTILERIQQERDNLNVELRINEMKNETYKNDIENLKIKYEKQLENIIDNEQKNLNKLREELIEQYEEKLKQQENKFQNNLARDWVSNILYNDLKKELQYIQKRFNESQNTIEFLQENESELNNQLIENEKLIRNLKKNLDDSTLQASKAALERTKAMNDKLQLETKVIELQQKLDKCEKDKYDLMLRITKQAEENSQSAAAITQQMFLRQQIKLNQKNSNELKIRNPPSSSGIGSEEASGYTSEEVPMMIKSSVNCVDSSSPPERNGNTYRRRHDNSSPDLGIESDVGGGRTSSVELVSAAQDITAADRLKTAGIASTTTSGDENEKENRNNSELDKTNASSDDVDTINNNNNTNSTSAPTTVTVATNTTSVTSTTTSPTKSTVKHDCAKVDQENEELRRKLRHTKHALEETWNKLRSANQRKEQIERDLRSQIEKTQKVLNNARINFEHELERKKK